MSTATIRAYYAWGLEPPCAQQVCAGWGDSAGVCQKRPGAHAFKADRIRKRNGQPWRCASCAAKKAASDPDIRSELKKRAGKGRATQEQDAAFRARNAEHLKKIRSSPESKARHSEALRRAWEKRRLKMEAIVNQNQVEEVLGEVEDFEVNSSGYYFRPTKAVTVQQMQALSDLFCTERIDFEPGEPGHYYSLWTYEDGVPARIVVYRGGA